jgi:hypothetical protein
MKSLFVVAFAVSTLLRPSLVLCMEQSGDVRLERQEAVCCESEHATADVVFSARTADDCDGCLDVALAMDSLRFKRVAPPSPTAPFFLLPAQSQTPLAASLATTWFPAPHGIQSFVLSTTVIRC